MIAGVKLRVVGTLTSSPVFRYPLHLMSTNLRTLLAAEISVAAAGPRAMSAFSFVLDSTAAGVWIDLSI